MESSQPVDFEMIAQLTGETAKAIAASPSAQAMGQLLIRDGLTGLYNRRYLQQRLRKEAEAGTPFALLVMDLNGFKRVNDSLGHAAGDRLLTEAAATISRRLPLGGIACRYGGDEFVLALLHWTLGEADGWASSLADDLRRLEVHLETGQTILGVGASIGIALYPDDASDFAELFAAADQAMYHAKQHNQGGIGLHSVLKGAHQLTSQLRIGWMAPIVGRSSERSKLKAAARSGAQLLCVTGGAGLGKSRLCAEETELARTEGWHVLAIQGPAGRPLGGISHLLTALCETESLAEHVRAARTELNESDQQLIARLLFGEEQIKDVTGSPPLYDNMVTADSFAAAAFRLLCAVSSRQRLWVWADDVDTWDDPSLTFIRYAAVQPLPASLVLLVAVNESEAPEHSDLTPLLRTMGRDGLPVVVMDLEPLSDTETSDVIRSVLLGETEPVLIQTLVTRSGRNPLALHTLLQQFIDQGQIIHSAGFWILTGTPAPAGDESLAGTIATKIEALSPQVRHLLEALAVSGSPWPSETIYRLCGTTPAEAAPLLDTAVRAQILMEEYGNYRFLDGIVRSMVAAQTGDLIRRAWHRVTAEVLEASGRASAAELADHWEQSGHKAQTISWHRRAAAEAEAFCAYNAAARHYRTAAEMGGDGTLPNGERELLWEMAGKAFLRAFRNRDAVLCFQRAMRPHAEPKEIAELMYHMASALQLLGEYGEASRLTDRALALVEGRPPSIILSKLYRLKSWLLCAASQFRQGLPLALKAVEIARTCHSPDAEAEGCSIVAWSHLGHGHHRQALRWAEQAYNIQGLTDSRCIVASNLATYHHNHRVRAELLKWVAGESARTGDIQGLLNAYFKLMRTEAALGHWAEAREAFDQFRRIAWRSGHVEDVIESYCEWGRYTIQRGQYTEAEVILLRCQNLCGSSFSNIRCIATLRAAIRLATEEPALAVVAIEEHLGDQRPRSLDAARLYYLAAEAELTLHRPDRAQVWLKHAVDCGRLLGVEPTEGPAHWTRGRIAEELGYPAEALRWYRAAQREPSSRWEKARTHLDEASLRFRFRLGTPDQAMRKALAAQRQARQHGFPSLAAFAETLLAQIRQQQPKGSSAWSAALG